MSCKCVWPKFPADMMEKSWKSEVRFLTPEPLPNRTRKAHSCRCELCSLPRANGYLCNIKENIVACGVVTGQHSRAPGQKPQWPSPPQLPAISPWHRGKRLGPGSASLQHEMGCSASVAEPLLRSRGETPTDEVISRSAGY